jgi:hypothetical protein
MYRMQYRLFQSGPILEVGRDSSIGISTTTGCTVRESNPGGGARFSTPVQNGPRAHPASYATGTGSLSREYSGRGVMLTTHPI